MKSLLLINLIIAFSLFNACSSQIPVDETKIHDRINKFYIEVLKNPTSYKPISFSKLDTFYLSESQVKLKIKTIFSLNDKAKTGEWEITVTKDDIIILPTKDYEKDLMQY